jgi:tRNA(Ile)-lysidine synthase
MNPEKNGVSIRIEKLLATSSPQLMLYEFLKNYHFSGPVCEDLFKSLNAQAGKLFFSKTHKAIKDRDQIFIVPLGQDAFEQEYAIDSTTSRLEVPGAFFTFETFNADEKLEWPENESSALLDFDRLQFPLLLRKVKSGDRFVPLGMKGKKKINDLLTDEKTPIHLKQEVWVLVSGNEIVWVAGHRISNHFRITPATRKGLLAKIVKS